MTGPDVQFGLGVLLLLGMLVVAVLSWVAARRALRPRDVFGLEDKGLSRLQTLRSYVGFVVVLVATWPVRGTPRFLADYVIHIAEALLLGIAAVVVCILVAVLLSTQRGPLAKRAWRPFWKMVLTFGPLFAGLSLGGLPVVTRTLANTHATIRGVFLESPVGWFLLFLLWLLLYTVVAICYSARFLYCPGEVHPMLAPLAAVMAVTAVATLDISRSMGWFTPLLDAFGRLLGRPTPAYDLHPTPITVALILAISGWLSTVVLGAREWQELRRAPHGVSFRKVPHLSATAP